MLRLYKELKSAVLKEDIYGTNEIIERIKKQSDAFDYIELMLELMEKNPNLDFGDPGPMVHFMEMYYRNGYENLLLDSLKRYPTIQTIWMANRILNDPNFNERESFLNVLKTSLNREDLTEDIQEEIIETINFQNR